MKSVNIFCLFSLHTLIILVQAKTNKNSLLIYSPEKGWVNDPNGLVYVDGTYHLFYQHTADSDKPGNICWGHAESRDLVDWVDKGVAIPYNATAKEHRYSGSAVYDLKNSSGFGKDSAPLVAIYTSYYAENSTCPDGSPVIKGTQSQSIAYSQDKGETWHTYSGNPVIRHPPPEYADQYLNFRDPKVFWYEPQGKWVMVTVLSKLKKALFHSSTDLKDWTYMSEFSSKNAPVDAIWECPDLYKMDVLQRNESKWVLSISIQPANAADVNQFMCYFIGRFDGTKFVEDVNEMATIKLVDHGSDFYAGVTWNNVGNRILIIGWVDNWAYARNITDKYRGGLSLVREVFLKKKGNEYKLIQRPNKYIHNYVKEVHYYTKKEVENGIIMTRNNAYNFIVNITINTKNTYFSFVVEDDQKNLEAKIGYNRKLKNFSIKKRNVDLQEHGELNVHHETKLDSGPELMLNIFIDDNSITSFVGDEVFTELSFSKSEMRKFKLLAGSNAEVSVTQFLLGR